MNSMMLGGFRVYENPHIPEFMPRMQLSPKCAEILPPEFRDEMNAWMVEFFGKTRNVVVNEGARTIHAHPRNIEYLQQAAAASGVRSEPR